jgi:hypothetical protein
MHRLSNGEKHALPGQAMFNREFQCGDEVGNICLYRRFSELPPA